MVALFLLGKELLGLSIIKSVGLGILVLLIAFIVSFIRYLVTNTSRSSAYGDAIVFLKDGFGLINHLKRENSNSNEDIIDSLVQICNTLKKVFDRLTKADCSVSIKLPILNEPISSDAIVENVCRDFSHYLVRNTAEYKKQVHRVNGSTAYQVIINNVLNGERSNFYYLNNNVPKTENYQTTSKPAYLEGILPYKSELVYPVLPMTEPKEKREDGKIKYEIWGFICVDCPLTYKFNNRYHVQIIEGVADGVFDVIMKINKSRTL